MNAKTDDVVIDFKNVVHEFGHVVAVEDLNLQVKKGERVAILGRTGAGKSTVMNLLVGNMTPTHGTIRVNGKDPYAEHDALQGKIGMAFQGPRLLPWRTAEANVAIGQEILKVKKPERLENAHKWLSKMQLKDAAKMYPNQLSGGMRQRVSLARAFAIDPAFILLDESFSALDEVTARELRDDFVALADAEQKTAVIVTHNIEEAFAIAHRVILLGRPARILAEYHSAQEPQVGTPEFTRLRKTIHDLMVSAPTEAASS